MQACSAASTCPNLPVGINLSCKPQQLDLVHVARPLRPTAVLRQSWVSAHASNASLPWCGVLRTHSLLNITHSIVAYLNYLVEKDICILHYAASSNLHSLRTAWCMLIRTRHAYPTAAPSAYKADMVNYNWASYVALQLALRDIVFTGPPILLYWILYVMLASSVRLCCWGQGKNAIYRLTQQMTI